MKFLTGLCQDDVITSSDDVISRKKLHSHVREKILGSHQRNFENRSWFRSYAAKSRPGSKFTPPPWFYVCQCRENLRLISRESCFISQISRAQLFCLILIELCWVAESKSFLQFCNLNYVHQLFAITDVLRMTGQACNHIKESNT